METQYLYFPQWQGSGNHIDLFEGSELLYKRLKHSFDFDRVNVDTEVREEETSVKYLYEIKAQLLGAIKLIDSKTPDSIFTLGGDCGIELAPVSYLNKKYDGDLTILWIDAHADLNTPQSSPSGHFHGMPLRALLGEGESTILENLYSSLKPSQIHLAGVRNLDNAERSYISENGISCSFVQNIMHSFREVTEYLSALGSRNVYVHLDLDVIDLSDISGVPCAEEGGLSYEATLALVEELKLRYNVVGGSICEFNGNLESEVKKVVRLTQALFE